MRRAEMELVNKMYNEGCKKSREEVFDLVNQQGEELLKTTTDRKIAAGIRLLMERIETERAKPHDGNN